MLGAKSLLAPASRACLRLPELEPSTLFSGYFEIDSPRALTRQRGRALVTIYSLFALIICVYLPYVLVADAYEGRRAMFFGVVSAIGVFFLLNAALCRRGRIDLSISFVGVVAGAGIFVNSAAVGSLRPSVWLLVSLSLLAMFAERPRQVIINILLALAVLISIGVALGGDVPGVRLTDELGRSAVLMLLGAFFAFQIAVAHRAMLARMRANQDETRQAMFLAQEQREIADHARHQAEIANEEKGAFLAHISHELRTPLNAILGYSEILVEELEDMDDPPVIITRDAEKIQIASRHLLELIQDVLDLSDIESGELQMKTRRFDLVSMCREIAVSMELAARTRGNSLALDTSVDELWISCDPTWIRQILFNLLSNSAKFTSGGSITIRVEQTEAQVELCVEDDGCGMSEEQRARIFEEFVQADALTLREFGGTGLGLPLCHRLATQMGGELTLTSAEGEGTEVCLVLANELVEAP